MRGSRPLGSRPAASRPHSSKPSWRVASEPPPPLQIGNYRILYQLASGGTSSVYVAEQQGRPDAVYAVKVMDKIERDERGLLTFLAEARVTTSLDHDNVVRTLESGDHEGVPFLVMELLLGASLSELLAACRRHGRQLDPWLASWVIEKAARGLHHAHELRDASGNPIQLVHRDISPQNILLSFQGRVALSDFGIAKFSDRGMTTAKGLLKGRFAYMSPEHARGETVDRRSDIFSLGIVLFEALTLQRAFDGKSAGDSILRLLHMKRIDPGAIRPDVPAKLSEIVAKACASDPTQRFASASEFADALATAREVQGAGDATAALGAMITTHFQQRQKHLHNTQAESAPQQSQSGPAERPASAPPSAKPALPPWGIAIAAVCALAMLVVLVALIFR